jgi:tRNA (guanine-N7-)-methyltransferase
MKASKDLIIPYSWAERRPVLLDRCLYIPGFYDRHFEWERISWSDPRLFGNEQPVILEFCSGNGQWIGDRAKQNPERNWVAVEKRFDRARKIWLKIQREQIRNLYVVCGEAVVFARHYAPLHSASEVYVNFPDPWPKLRHAKHRLVRAEFLQEIECITNAQGKATFVTDDPDYKSWMLEEIAKCPAWSPLLTSPFYTTEQSDYGNSYFADLWKGKGRVIHYIPIQKVLPCTQL